MKLDVNIGFPTEPMTDGENRRFRIDPTAPEGIFCDSPGARPGSILFGIGLDPVVRCPGSGDQISRSYRGGLHCDACGQKLLDVPGVIPEHEVTDEAASAYGLDIQQGAIWVDATRDEIAAMQAMLQRLIDDNAGTGPGWEVA